MRKTLVFMALFSILLPGASQAKEDKETLILYGEAKSSYENGDYKECIEKFEKLLNELRITTIDRIIDAHTMLGASYYFEEQEEKSKDHFRTVLNFNSDLELSPYDYPPKVVEFYNEIKRVRKLEEAVGKREEPVIKGTTESPKEAADNKKISEERIFEKETSIDQNKRNPLGNSFIPFGVGQFKNNEPGKGQFFLYSQALTLAGVISTAIAFKSLQRSDGSFDEPAVGRGLENGFYTSVIFYMTLTLTGIIDACVNHREFPYAKTGAPPISFSIVPGERKGIAFLIGFKN